MQHTIGYYYSIHFLIHWFNLILFIAHAIILINLEWNFYDKIKHCYILNIIYFLNLIKEWSINNDICSIIESLSTVKS